MMNKQYYNATMCQKIISDIDLKIAQDKARLDLYILMVTLLNNKRTIFN